MSQIGKTITEAAQVWEVSYQRAQQIMAEFEVLTVRFGRNNRYVRIPESEVERVRVARQIPELVKT